RMPLTVGALGPGGAEAFAGSMDEVAVYARDLDEYEIRALADPQRWQDLPVADAGAALTPWSTQVAGVEGPHQVDLRVTDQFGRANLVPDVWAGEFDTAAPRVTLTLQGDYSPFAMHGYRLSVKDYNARGHVFTDAVGADCTYTGTNAIEYLDETWYTDVYTTPKAVAINPPGRGLEDDKAPFTLRACDLFNQCASVTVGPNDLTVQRLATGPDAFVSAVNSPMDGAALDVLAPVTVEGVAYALDALRAVTVSVNGVPTSVMTWTVTSYVTQTLWTTTWTPVAEGTYTITTQVLDWAGDSTTDTVPGPTVTIDVAPPQVVITTDSITDATFDDAGYVTVGGMVTDSVGVARLQVRYGDLPWTEARVPTDTHTFTAAVWSGSNVPPAGEPVTLSARATDAAGHAVEVSRVVWADAVAPDGVTVTLTHRDGVGGATVISPGITLRDDSAPALGIAWTGSASTDVVGYRAGWSESAVPDASLTLYGPAAREHVGVASEAQRLYAHVIVVDVAGNSTSQTLGPIYVDEHLTPAYAPAPVAEHTIGWLDEPCNLVGVDSRAARTGSDGNAGTPEQRFYTTWDADNLRLAWSGADWDVQGDLYLYLDTGAGGTSLAYNPYAGEPAADELSLPGVTPASTVGGEPRSGDPARLMKADLMIQIEDSATAWLWRWSGTAWVTDTQLSAANFRYDPSLYDGLTELALPFSQVGLPAGGALSVVAFATEETSMRLWATMPAENPVSSVLAGAPAGTDAVAFGLARAYRWNMLATGICPSAGTPDTDALVTVVTTPAGRMARYFEDGLVRLWDPMFGAPPADVSTSFGTEGQLLGVGLPISTTISYHNRGTETASGVSLRVTAHYGLQLVGSNPEFVDLLLGDVAPGESASATVQGETVADAEPWAAIDVLVYDHAHPDSGPPVEWVWIDHRLDDAAPQFYGISAPSVWVPTRTTTLRGYAYDRSGVPVVRAEVTTPAGATRLLVCPDITPQDGVWACPWDLVSANGGIALVEGDTFAVRIRASDAFGQTGDWTPAYRFQVDAEPPDVTLSGTTAGAQALVVNRTPYALRGTVVDNHGLGDVFVCEDSVCETAQLWLDPASGSAAAGLTVDDLPAGPVSLGGTVCSERTFVVSDTVTIGEVRVGLAISHTHRDDLRVVLRSPSGTEVAIVTPDGRDVAQHYDVLLYDGATGFLHTTRNDEFDAPTYDREARPSAPLLAFLDEEGQGTWTLSICDTDPTASDGSYRGGRLILVPQDGALRAGRWYFSVFGDEQTLDFESRSFEIYAADAAGNRTTAPLRVTVVADSVPPEIVVTDWPQAPSSLDDVLRFAGTVSDSGAVGVVRLAGTAPDGTDVASRVTFDAGTWVLTDTLWLSQAGTYALFVEAEDEAGNVGVVGPLPVVLVAQAEIAHVYLPCVVRQYHAAPDLIVNEIRPGALGVEVVIKNKGNAPVTEAFWVDLYIDPSPEPTEVNQIWNDVAGEGMVWGVTAAALPLAPGEEMTLRMYDGAYWASYSQVDWPPRDGAAIWAQVDSANTGTTYGAVLEDHEIAGGFYNNFDIV
ncbi:MAG: proprotein convertase P-domain-containing protein, partial [Anaerolineae bacterium]|nr:proprotein convertase P-domain-containing protein [Anaerolineae bacterium]